MIVPYLLFNVMLQNVHITQGRNNDELISRLEPELWERAFALRRLILPLPDSQTDGLLEQLVRQRVPVHGESEECRSHSQLVVDSVVSGESWALHMFDASSKFPSGVLEVILDVGNYHECLRSTEPNQLFTGQHCLVETRGILPQELHDRINYNISYPHWIDVDRIMLIKDITFSVCVPSSCSARDVKAHMDRVLAAVNATSLVYESSCSSVQPVPYTPSDYMAISIFLGILAVVAWCSVTDIRSSGKKSDVVVAFSVPRNWRQLVNTEVGSPGDIPCLHGLKVLMTIAIIIVHRPFSELMLTTFSVLSVSQMLGTLLAAVIENLSQAVDVFFVIGGTVRAYGFFQDRHKGKPFDIGKSIARRYFRYTPTLAVVMLYTATLMSRSASGPLWGRTMDFPRRKCQVFWPVNFLYIQNYVGGDFSCVPESWYLAADLQLFIFSTLILIPLYFRPKLGLTLMTLSAMGSLVVYIITSYVLEADACNSSFFFPRNNNELLLGTYFYAHLRATSYILGLGLGYLIFTIEKSKKRIKLPKVVVRLGWILSLAIPVSLVAVYKIVLTPDYQYTPGMDIFITVFSKFLMSIAAAWIIFVCAMGYGGAVNDFLSNRVFHVLSKLALGVYLVDYGIVGNVLTARRITPLDFDQMLLFLLIVADLLLVIALAVPLYLFIEQPCYRLATLYWTTPAPSDPIAANITAKTDNRSDSAVKRMTPANSIETTSRKVKKRNKT